MSDLRPQINYGQVVCDKCNMPCDFESTAIHSGGGVGHEGQILIRATHHGEEVDIAVSFAEMRKDPEREIRVFEGQLKLCQKNS